MYFKGVVLVSLFLRWSHHAHAVKLLNFVLELLLRNVSLHLHGRGQEIVFNAEWLLHQLHLGWLFEGIELGLDSELIHVIEDSLL